MPSSGASSRRHTTWARPASTSATATVSSTPRPRCGSSASSWLSPGGRLVHVVVNHSEWSLEEFVRAYPDDAACLDYLWRERFAPDGHTADCPKCNQPRRFHRVQSRASYSCDACGRHVHPTKGTIFEGS